jgi:hypothetical protein
MTATDGTGLRLRPGDQPLPARNDGADDIQSLVIADIEARRQIGIGRYGTALKPFNGRDGHRDRYEEMLDWLMYERQLQVERDAMWDEGAIKERIIRALARSAGDSQADAVMAVIRALLTAVATDQHTRTAVLEDEIARLRAAL